MPSPLSDACAASSAISLIPKVVKIYDDPGFLASKIFDPYWEKPFKKCQQVAEVEVKKVQLMLNESSNRVTMLTTEEEEQLSNGIHLIRRQTRQYQAAVRNKEPKGAQEACGDLQTAIIRLNDNRSASRTRSLSRELETSDYALISSRRNDTMVLTNVRNPKLDWERTPSVDSLKRLTTWFAHKHVTHRVHWLQGPPRCGKTMILRHITEDYLEPLENNLLASMTFNSTINLDCFTTHFLPTIIDQIARRHPALKKSLATLCRKLPEDYFTATPMGLQVQNLFIAPLEALLPSGSSPLVVVLDGVDACGDDSLHLLWSFMKQTIQSRLPIYFLITASDSPRIKRCLLSSGLSKAMDVNVVEDYKVARQRMIQEWDATQEAMRAAGSPSSQSP